MKQLIVLLFLLPVIAFAQNPSTGGFILEGKMDGYADGTTVQLYKNGDNAQIAAGTIQKGKFELKGTLGEANLCFLAIADQRPIEIFIDLGKQTVKADKSRPGVYEVSGSVPHNVFSSFTATFVPMVQQLSGLGNSVNSSMPGPQRDALMNSYNETRQQMQNAIDDFINKNPGSLVSPFVLEATYGFNEDVVMLENRFNKLQAAIKNSEAGKKLQQTIAVNKVGAIGTMAMDFTQEDTAGRPVSLSSFRGKYVLVDFWASWCGPCRQENPHVVESFQNFKDKNFTVLGVSLDRPGQKDKWLAAIKEDNLTWTHVSDLKFWNNAVAMMYNVRGIPQNFLIDPQGMIVAKNLRGPALNQKLCELLGCN